MWGVGVKASGWQEVTCFGLWQCPKPHQEGHRQVWPKHKTNQERNSSELLGGAQATPSSQLPSVKPKTTFQNRFLRILKQAGFWWMKGKEMCEGEGKNTEATANTRTTPTLPPCELHRPALRIRLNISRDGESRPCHSTHQIHTAQWLLRCSLLRPKHENARYTGFQAENSGGFSEWAALAAAHTCSRLYRSSTFHNADASEHTKWDRKATEANKAQ